MDERTFEQIVADNKKHIRYALECYGKHSTACMSAIELALEDPDERFIDKLAVDNAVSKKALRELFSKSPAWHPELDAIVVNGTRTHDPDPERVYYFANKLVEPYVAKYAYWTPDYRPATFDEIEREQDWRNKERDLGVIRDFFYTMTANKATDTRDISNGDRYLEVINRIAPNAYKPGKKLSKVFREILIALGVWDETPNSQCQQLFAQFADEINSRQINFKLFISVNPGHQLTMSNPKWDERGACLTSCHSLNSTDYAFNNGCSGYARDDVSFIVFTVANPKDEELQYNRKTTRQMFFYNPHQPGLLIQSRMYNTSGGTVGAQSESAVYRDLVQREISECEGAINYWDTKKLSGGYYHYITRDDDFGGYPDWEHQDFSPRISIRNTVDITHYAPIFVGEAGLCFNCGEPINRYLLCGHCEDGDEESGRYTCQSCGEYGFDEDDLYYVHDEYGNGMDVCEDCFDRYFTQCECCNEYYPTDSMHETVDENYVCGYCYDHNYIECDDCGYAVDVDDSTEVNNSYGGTSQVCCNCRDLHYTECEECGDYFPSDNIRRMRRDEAFYYYCDDCFEEIQSAEAEEELLETVEETDREEAA